MRKKREKKSGSLNYTFCRAWSVLKSLGRKHKLRRYTLRNAQKGTKKRSRHKKGTMAWKQKGGAPDFTCKGKKDRRRACGIRDRGEQEVTEVGGETRSNKRGRGSVNNGGLKKKR